eukprot:TRINITY_DN52882_c0_g1_i1.p1 TRINITY_DN52882_c0_g1~~TRINITY_DN52882_c0_g1_i1.p1  ORF type:complete len:255 (-),score=49.41 TRINITY_DN52882_c0_g1_i1:40-804(-)
MADDRRESAEDAFVADRSTDSQEDNSILLVNDADYERDEADTSIESLDSWYIVRNRVAAAASAVQRPLQFFIGECETEITITAPKWALISLMGLGVAILWQQERRIQATQAMLEKHHEGFLRLAETLVASSNRALELETAATERAATAMKLDRDNSLIAAAGVLATSVALLPWLIFSDQRLKTDLCRLPGTLGRCQLYSWKWSEAAEAEFGLSGISGGVLAQDVVAVDPEAVQVGLDGYMRVNYKLLVERYAFS